MSGKEFRWAWYFISTHPSVQRRQWHPTPVLLPGKSHGRGSLVVCSPWGREQSDTTGRLHFHFSLSCIGEGNGNPLQCSCLENPRDGEAWWAAIYRVAQSRTRLKRLSSSSSSSTHLSTHLFQTWVDFGLSCIFPCSSLSFSYWFTASWGGTSPHSTYCSSVPKCP